MQVSSKNLFDGSAKPEPKAGAAPVAEEAEGGVDTMQQMFTDFNIDRKVGQGMEALRKAFDLPTDAVRPRKPRLQPRPIWAAALRTRAATP